MIGPRFHITVNPTDTAGAVERRFRAVFDAEALARCEEDAATAQAHGLRHRYHLLQEVARVLRRADRVAGLVDEWGQP